MPRVHGADIDGANIFTKVLERCPDIAQALGVLDSTIRFSPRIEPSLKEELRRITAEQIGCSYCASLAAPKTEHTRREALAAGFASMIIENPREIDDSAFDVLREEFNEEQIIELVSWICFVLIGCQTFGAVMKLEPATDHDRTVYADWRAEGEAAAAVRMRG
jgi:alkylhydroperoxidase family enzyme